MQPGRSGDKPAGGSIGLLGTRLLKSRKSLEKDEAKGNVGAVDEDEDGKGEVLSGIVKSGGAESEVDSLGA